MCRVCSVETGDEELHISWYGCHLTSQVAVVRAYRLGVFREGSEFVLETKDWSLPFRPSSREPRFV